MSFDPWLPTGTGVFSAERPVSGDEPPACSLKRPVCVHRAPGTSPEAALRVLGALEQAYERLVLAMALPPPLGDLGRGGSSALDLYLFPGADLELSVGHDSPEVDFADRAAAFCRLQMPEHAAVQRAATLCVAEAVALGLDAAESPHLRRALATHLWWVAGRPTDKDLEAIDDVQTRPQRAVLTSARDRYSEGAALFLEYLDTTYSQGNPGALGVSLVAIGAGKTAPGASDWDNNPDVMDVLRASLGGKPRRMAELMAGFAVERAFVGARDDGTHLPSVGWAGEFGRVRFDWVIDWSSLPRRVASAHPIDPTGSVYVWLRLDEPPGASTLAMQAQWESPTEFAWVLVGIGSDGRERSRFVVPYLQRATSVEYRLENFADATSLVIVGTNLGGVDASHPFDPDVTPFEGHACTVYLVRL